MSNTSNVIVYSSANCPYCTQLKNYLKDQQIDFEERNISLNDEYAEELQSMGISSVPLTVIGEHKILGMNITRLKQALAG